MGVYIQATATISPQKTFGRVPFLTEPVEYTSTRLKSIEPDYTAFIDVKSLRRMSRIIKMGVAAAMECLQEAGVKAPDAIVTGTAYGCLEDTNSFLSKMVEFNEELLTPTSFIQSTHNTIGAQIGLMLQCNNYNNAFVHRGFSFESALLDGMLLLKEGEKGQFLIPSYLAFAESPPAGVAKNEVILLEIELLKLFSEDEKIDLFIKKKKLNVTEKTSTGLRFIRTNEPTKEEILKTGDVLSVKYNGMYLNETSFDSGTFPYTIGAGNVIAGFSEGLGKLKKGEKAKLVFPSSIGYGTTGNSKIPPFAPLIFDVEILSVNSK